MSLSNISLAKLSNTPAILSTTTPLGANSGRLGIFIQNLGTNPLYVRFGTGASTTVFDVCLAAGTSNDNGTGGSYENPASFVPISEVTIAGTSPRYIIREYVQNLY